MVQDMAANIPIGHVAEDSTEAQLNELKRVLPSEIARVATKIGKLEKELQQLEECKLDVTENLFHGLDGDDGIGEGLEPKANVRNLAVWRRLNEFKSDISREKQSIENEALRVESQIVRLKESKKWLTDMSIKVNQIPINGGDVFERNRMIKEFKGYLRKKIGLDKLEKDDIEGKSNKRSERDTQS